MARTTTTTTARTTAPATTTARKGSTVKTTAITRKTTTTVPAAPARKRAAAPAAPVSYRGVAVAGYTVRWPHGGYDLLKTTDASADRAAWLVRCNDHGEMGTVENTREGDVAGSRASRATWCKGCIAAARAAA